MSLNFNVKDRFENHQNKTALFWLKLYFQNLLIKPFCLHYHEIILIFTREKKIPTKLYLLFLYIWTVVLLNTHSDPTCVCMCFVCVCLLCVCVCVYVCVCVCVWVNTYVNKLRDQEIHLFWVMTSLPHSSSSTKEKSEPCPTHTPSTDEWCWLSS